MENIMSIFPQNVTEALGFTLLHSIWQAAVLLLIYILMAQLTKKSSHKYNIGLLFMGLLSAISFITYYIIYEPLPTLQYTGNVINFENAAVISNNVTAQSDFSVWQISNWFSDKIPFLVNIWVVGLLFYFTRFGYNFWQVNQLKTKDLIKPNKQTLEIFNKLKAIISDKNEQLMESSRVYTPVLIGYLKPIILLPIGLCTQLSAKEIEAILAHELAHSKRNDYLINLGQSVLDIIYFFNPAFMVLSNFVREERENCCDEYASKICGDNTSIAKALINLESFRQETYLAMAFGQKRNLLKNRVQKILGVAPDKANQNKGVFFVVSFIIATILYVNIENTVAQTQQPPKKKTTKTTHSRKTHYEYTNDDNGTNKIYAENEKGALQLEQKNGTIYVNGTPYPLSPADSIKMMEHAAEIKRLSEEINKYSSKMGELGAQMGKLGAENAARYEPVASQSQAMASLSQKMASLSQKQASISQSMAGLDPEKNKKRIEQLEKQEKIYDEQIEILEKQMDKMEEEIEKVSEQAEMNSAPMDSLEREMEKLEEPIEDLSKKIEEHSMAMYKLYPKEAKEAFENFTGEKNGLGIPLPPKPPKAPKPPRLPKAPMPPKPPKAPKPPKPPIVDNRSGYSAPSKIGAIAPELEIAAPIEVESPVAMVEPIEILAPVAPIAKYSYHATPKPLKASKRK